ncbi:MAG: tetratricopeptide repeat protein [Bacteroidota bacterium]
MPSLKALYRSLLLLMLLLLPVDCSVEKNTASTRFYHGMTARYNIYFNGYESYKSGLLKMINGYTDDYADLLRVFEYSDPASPSRCSSDMERAIQKASKLISLKSITAKPEGREREKLTPEEEDLLNRKEYNAWVDNSYLLIARARFYKHEYNEAEALFEYCISQANDPVIRQEASIWLARIQNEKGRYSDSYRTLTEIEIPAKSPGELQSMYHTTMVDLFVRQQKYADAIDPLEKAIAFASGKRSKYRLTYLLAQLNEKAGNSSAAIALYRDVVKMNPPYDVEFNARINIAGVFDVNSGNPKEIRKEMERMLKDSKNADFQDQIYFALGNLSMKEGNETGALDFYRQSVSVSSVNQNQKGRSYMALADYYYRKPDLINAGKYYDSTVVFLSTSHPEYLALKTKSTNLNAVVSHLAVIQTEDSLQKVARMPESERNALISGIINDITKAESEGKTSQYSDRYNLGQFYENERRFQDNIEQEGKWYFYNQAALTFGRTEFKRRWGDRRLEDNWRRVNKARTSGALSESDSEEDTQNSADSSVAQVVDYKKPEYYLKNLPLTDSLMVASDSRIANAYLNAGKAYAEKILDMNGASESFEKILTRFPGNELVPETLYNLYNLNKGIDYPKSEIYRQRLVENYPETEFAKMISDPGYYDKKMESRKMSEEHYREAYDNYIRENFYVTMAMCDSALMKFSQDPLAPKFRLLRAYSVARISDERSFKDELNIIIKQWPGSEEAKKAGEIVAFINQEIPELKVEEEKKIAEELYVADTAVAHVFALVIENPAFNINQATFDVISYNIDNYTNLNYRTEGILVDNKYIIITVSGFQKYLQAMEYYSSFSAEKLVRNPSSSKMYSFIINSANMKVLDNDKKPERYLIFFNENYLK